MYTKEEIVKLFSEIYFFQKSTFPDSTPQSIANHLLSEAKELVENPTDGSEMADIVMLLFCLLWKTKTDIYQELSKKLEINKSRTWGDKNQDGFVEHIRE